MGRVLSYSPFDCVCVDRTNRAGAMVLKTTMTTKKAQPQQTQTRTDVVDAADTTSSPPRYPAFINLIETETRRNDSKERREGVRGGSVGDG